MKVKKAGCILLNIENKKIGLIYREKYKDYSFPKGHLEENETLQECAIRETREETLRECVIIDNKELAILSYTDSVGDEIDVYYYLAVDKGETNAKIAEEDREEIVWKDISEVEKVLSYPNLVEFWKKIKDKIMKTLENESY